MGMDQCAYKVKKKDVIDDFSAKGLEPNNPSFPEEDWYWRKNHALHRFMDPLFYQKLRKAGKSTDIDFNGRLVRVTMKDLKQLREETELESAGVRQDAADDGEEYEGDYEQNDRRAILEFCEEAIIAIHCGYAIYYIAGW